MEHADLIKFVTALRESGATITGLVVASAATGIVKKTRPQVLKDAGGTLQFSERWGWSQIAKAGWADKAASTGHRHPNKDVDRKNEFLLSVVLFLLKFNIPWKAVTNRDQSGVNIAYVGKRTMAPKGNERVALTGAEDKRQRGRLWQAPRRAAHCYGQAPRRAARDGVSVHRFGLGKQCPQVTGTFGSSAAGVRMPSQVIYGGKTAGCHPNYIPPGWCVTHRPNHWSNEEKVLQDKNE
eukprot:gene16362-6394_t